MRRKAVNTSLIKCIGFFLKEYLPSIRMRSEATISSYKYTINLYLDYLKCKYGITIMKIAASDFSQDKISGFLNWLKESRNNSAPTINHRLSDIRGFCKYLMRQSVITSIEYELIREIEEVQDERKIEFVWLTTEEIKQILEHVEKNKNAQRDYFMIAFLYESGCRSNEIRTLKIQDLKFTANGELDALFIGKGNKRRITPLSKEIAEMYADYCKKYHSQKTEDDFVFYTIRDKQHKKMSNDNIIRILNAIEDDIRTINPNFPHLHPHLFRRSRAMHLYEAGMPLATISEWLGHSQIETTRIYAQLTTEMKRKAIEKFSTGENAVFSDDIAFKYANDEEVLRKLCGLK